jgi:superfamily II DNA helicase RecQ
MPVRIFTIPFDVQHKLFQDEELNRFCLSRQVAPKRAEFFSWQGKAWWTVWLEYEEAGREDVLPEGLDATQTATYKRLKEWRFTMAEKQGLPAYVVAANRKQAEQALRNASG